MKRLLENVSEEIETIILTKLCFGMFSIDDIENMKRLYTCGDNGNYIVVVIQKKKMAKENLLENFFDFNEFCKVMEDTIQDYGRGRLLLVGNNLFAVTMEVDKQYVTDCVYQELIYKMYTMVEKHFFSCFMSVGEMYSNIEGLHLSYMQAMKNLRCSFLCEGNVILHEHIKESKEVCNVDCLEDFNRFIYGDEVLNLEEYIDNIVENIIAKEEYNVYNSVMFKSEMVMTMKKLFDSITYDDRNKIIYKMIDAGTLEEIKELLCEGLVECRNNFAINRNDKNVSTMIATHIDKHFSETTLSLVSLADEFKISQSHMSKIFKKTYGKTVSNYIGDVRVEAVKEELLKDGFGLEEIAEKTGFLSANSMIRFFKKHEGITPGKFRKNKKGSNSEPH